MSFWQKEKEVKTDAVTELQQELEAEMQNETTDAVTELSLEEKLALEAEEEIRMEKQAEEAETADEEESEAEESGAGEAAEETAEEETAEEDEGEKSGTEVPETSEGTSTDFRLLRKLEFLDKIKPYRRYLIGAAVLVVGVFLILWGVSKYSSVSGDIEETESTEQPADERAVAAIAYTPQRQLPDGEKPDTEYMSYQAMQDSLKGWISEFGRINIRDKADFEGQIVDYVVYGDQVSVFEQEGEFTRIKYVSPVSGETMEGYCFSEYISRTEPEGPQVYLNVPLYKQADQRWGAVKIGSYETLASAGCTTTCISMVESYMNGSDIFPDDVKETLYYTYDGRLVFPEYYFHHWARDYMTVAMQKLHEGIPVLVSGYNAAGGTHWVVLVAYKGDGVDLSSDLFLINDPGSPRYTLTDFMRDYPFIEKIVYYNK